MPDGSVVRRSRIRHELHPDRFHRLGGAELKGRERLEERFGSEEDHQFSVFDDLSATAENLVALLVNLTGLTLDELATVVRLNL